MKKTTALVLITLLFSFTGCAKKHTLTPKLKTINANTDKLHNCNTTYTIEKDGNVTIPLKDAKCIISKLKKCQKNTKKLIVANTALNAQIYLLNGLN